jgi:toxin ParE1/3/4
MTRPRHDVLLTAGADQDIESIHDHIAGFDSSANADHVLDRLMKVVLFPKRGSHPKELLALGIREYRQIFFRPYRLIYRIVERRVYIHLIADERRDMQSLLARRLLGA